jgi:signal transduction histidine kinase
MLENESLTSMGRALAAVAHDLKTPLIAIGGYTRLVQKKLGRDDSSYEKLGVVINETARLEAMVKDMLDFSRPLRIERSKVDLNEIVKESVTIVEETTKIKDVKVETRLSNGLPAVSIDALRMKQVFLNLFLNAIEASPEREIVTVKTCLEDGYVRIDIADNGCGIPPEETDKIFTPFFTKKKGGTGLGLPIAKKIVQAHKGSLEVFNGTGNGATFKVTIPIPRKMSTPGQNLSKM